MLKKKKKTKKYDMRSTNVKDRFPGGLLSINGPGSFRSQAENVGMSYDIIKRVRAQKRTIL